MSLTVEHGERGATDEVAERSKIPRSCSSCGTLPGKGRPTGIVGYGHCCGGNAANVASCQ
jgi:hypothetical protein